MSEPSSATVTILDYIKMRNLDVICDDTDLDNHQFPITKISWRLNRNGEIMKSQQVNVSYENSLVITTAVLNSVTSHRWNGHRQVKMVITRHCSNGYVYEIFWKTFTMRLPQLLPPNGYAYEMVAKFLMSEQRLLDEDQTDEESDVEMVVEDHIEDNSNGHEGEDDDGEEHKTDPEDSDDHQDEDDDDNQDNSNGRAEPVGHEPITTSDDDDPEDDEDDEDDDLTDMEPVNVEVILNSTPPVTNVLTPFDDSDHSAEDDLPIDKFASARRMFQSMYNARRSDSAAGSSDAVSM